MGTRLALVLAAALVGCVLVSGFPALARAEQASEPASVAAGGLDAGALHTCALVGGGVVRCWGYGGNGQLGYGNTDSVGDDETPASVSPVDLGRGRSAKAISAGDYHTCAILDDGSVRCWGYGGNGRLGYASSSNVGDRQTPGSVGPVDLGAGRTATAISAGGAHTCAILDNGSVLCWGYGGQGQLGYGNTADVGDNETPGSVGPVSLGPHAARAISAGAAHTCAVLDDGNVRCWGFGGFGRLGYGNTANLGDTPATTPDKVGPVSLGTGRSAVAISAGVHTCAVLDDASVRCWGYGGLGQLGYGSPRNLGDQLTPDMAGPVNLGPGRGALAISAGQLHTCALLDNATVRCWGFNNDGRLGYANTNTVGDVQTPDSAGPVDLGAGRSATAITAGQNHTCARLDDGHVRCWGSGVNGRLGYCNEANVGDHQTPGSVGPVNLQAGDGGANCIATAPPPVGSGQSNVGPHPVVHVTRPDPFVLQAQRRHDLRGCLARAARRRLRARPHARRATRPQTSNTAARRGCLRLYGRTPGRIERLRARAVSGTRIVLVFGAPGSDGSGPPAAESYLVKQSPRPIRGAHAFARAQALCRGRCRFSAVAVGTKIKLTITNLRPHTTYYYAIAARDNVSGRPGPRSQTVKAATR